MARKRSRVIVARRDLTLFRKGKESLVRVEIERPRKRKKFRYVCRFRIQHLPGHRDEWIRIYGMDSLDALLTTVHIIHVHLYFRLDRNRTKLTWIGTKDLGVPLTKGPFTNNRDAKGRVERPGKRQRGTN